MINLDYDQDDYIWLHCLSLLSDLKTAYLNLFRDVSKKSNDDKNIGAGKLE
jgi:hypothetical protein